MGPAMSVRSTARGPLAALALLTVAMLPAGAQGGPQPFAHEVALLTSAQSNSPTPWQAFDGGNLVFADVGGVRHPQVVASNDNLRHYVIDPRLGVVAELRTTHPDGGDAWLGRELDTPVVGDLFGDGRTEVVVENGAAFLSVWRFSPRDSTPSAYNLTMLWERPVDARQWDPHFADSHPYNAGLGPTSEGHPFLADADGHGWLTVFANAQDASTALAYFPNGTLRWWNDPPVDLNAGVAVADLRGDGHLEAVLASDHGPIYVEDARTGQMLWTYDTRCAGGTPQPDGSNCDWQQPGSISVTPRIASLAGPGKDICFGARQALPESNPGWYSTNASVVQALVDASHAKLLCLGPDGVPLWQVQLPFGNPHVDVAPVPFDVTGDGVQDLIWIDWNTIGHKPGNWQTTTRGPNLFALDGRDGSVLWTTNLTTGWSNKGMALADFLGDGRQLLLVEEYGGTGGDGLSLVDPHNGARLGWVPLHAGWQASRGPAVVDLYGDGQMEIVVPLMRGAAATWCAQQRPDLPCREGAIEVLATGQRFDAAWDGAPQWNLPAGPHAQPAMQAPPPEPPLRMAVHGTHAAGAAGLVGVALAVAAAAGVRLATPRRGRGGPGS
jgi:outer membrane protein assembly factor BamB